MHAAITAAVESTGRQLAALEAGDDEGLLSGSQSHEAACRALTSLPAAVLVLEAQTLADLTDANARLVAGISRRRDETATRMAGLAAGRRVNAAYGERGRATVVFPVRQA